VHVPFWFLADDETRRWLAKGREAQFQPDLNDNGYDLPVAASAWIAW
jgi:hypothetical protein